MESVEELVPIIYTPSKAENSGAQSETSGQRPAADGSRQQLASTPRSKTPQQNLAAMP
jgi:hypothetical protein